MRTRWNERARARLSYANVAATSALIIALSGGAFAATGGLPDKQGAFHACVKKSSGAVRIVNSASSCRKARKRRGRTVPGERAIAWNQKGQTGATGSGTPGQNGSAAASVIQGNSSDALTTAPNTEDQFPPSGYTPTQGLPVAMLQVAPNATTVVRDLFAQLDTAPGAGTSRTVRIVGFSPPRVVISCTIAGSATTCDSGQDAGTLNPGELHRISIFTSPVAPAATTGARWAFRATTP